MHALWRRAQDELLEIAPEAGIPRERLEMLRELALPDAEVLPRRAILQGGINDGGGEFERAVAQEGLEEREERGERLPRLPGLDASHERLVDRGDGGSDVRRTEGDGPRPRAEGDVRVLAEPFGVRLLAPELRAPARVRSQCEEDVFDGTFELASLEPDFERRRGGARGPRSRTKPIARAQASCHSVCAVRKGASNWSRATSR